jgi:hypothetical protein
MKYKENEEPRTKTPTIKFVPQHRFRCQRIAMATAKKGWGRIPRLASETGARCIPSASAWYVPHPFLQIWSGIFKNRSGAWIMIVSSEKRMERPMQIPLMLISSEFISEIPLEQDPPEETFLF